MIIKIVDKNFLKKASFDSLSLQTMAKVITSMLKFPADQAQKVLDKEDSKAAVSI